MISRARRSRSGFVIAPSPFIGQIRTLLKTRSSCPAMSIKSTYISATFLFDVTTLSSSTGHTFSYPSLAYNLSPKLSTIRRWRTVPLLLFQIPRLKSPIATCPAPFVSRRKCPQRHTRVTLQFLLEFEAITQNANTAKQNGMTYYTVPSNSSTYAIVFFRLFRVPVVSPSPVSSLSAFCKTIEKSNTRSRSLRNRSNCRAANLFDPGENGGRRLRCNWRAVGRSSRNSIAPKHIGRHDGARKTKSCVCLGFS